MKSYPVYFDLKSIIYKTSKKYSASENNKYHFDYVWSTINKNRGVALNIYLGTTDRRANYFAELEIKECKDENGNTFFTLSIDGKIVKTKTK